jgi:hypothetical protein
MLLGFLLVCRSAYPKPDSGVADGRSPESGA